MTTVPPEKLPCPKCHFEPVVNVLSVDGQRVGILCAQCFELRAIAVKPEAYNSNREVSL
ncbi:hypothetical protein [uncultured Nostoc sp.]|uniref:hypothetical protein n=1 Tax=uncultured Nostoc sp. TaxID=340711 RepID=UPI0035CA09EE